MVEICPTLVRRYSGLSIWPLHDLLDTLWADMEETSLGQRLPGELAGHLQAQADDINKLTLYPLTIGHARLLTSKKPFVCNLGLDECNMDDAMDERMDEAYFPEDSLPEDLRCLAPPSPGTVASVGPVKCSGPCRWARSGTPPLPLPGLESPKQERVFSPNTGARPKIINQVPSSDVPPPRHPRVWFLKKNQPIPSNDLILTLTVAPEKGKSDSDVIPDSPASPPPEDRGIYPADLVPAEPVSCQDEDRVISKAPVPKYIKAEFLLTAAVASQHFRQSAYAHGGHIWFQDSSNIGADPKKRRVCSLPLPEQVDQLNVTWNHKDWLLMLPAVLTDFYDF